MADLEDQLDNLRLLLLASIEGELSQKREQAEIADSTEAWLHALQGQVVSGGGGSGLVTVATCASHCFRTPYAGSVPKNALVQGAVPETVL